ncbi:MAG: hypothetical protein AAGF48_05190 [Pseudomonadota bacterium]
MRILIFIVAVVMAAEGHAACAIVPSKIVQCDALQRDVRYARDEPQYNQARLCNATREKMGLWRGPNIHVVHRDVKALFFEVLDDDEMVVARGTYNIGKQELTGWVPVANE